MSNAGRLIIAVSIGAVVALAHYGWKRFQAATIIVPVSGLVTLNGEPLPDTYVKFSPVPRKGQSPLDTNPGSHAYTNSEGYFTLVQVENDQPGVVVGEHKIILRSGYLGPGKPNSDGFVGERVPLTWRKGIRSVHVSWRGEKQATFQINTVADYLPAGRDAE